MVTTTANILVVDDAWINRTQVNATYLSAGNDDMMVMTSSVVTKYDSTNTALTGGVNTYDPTAYNSIQGVSLFRYDITSIAGGSSIDSAILHIYGGGSIMQAAAVFVYPITNYTWNKATVTWNNQPAHSSTIGKLNVFRNTLGTLASNINNDYGNKWQTLDITAYVRTQFTAGAKAEIMLVPDTGYTFNTSFKSSKHVNKSYITVTSTL